MEFKGTKGKWINGWGNGLTGPTSVSANNPTVDKERKYIPISKGKETIAIVIQQENNSIKELDANAKLIAAAPELLEALQEILKGDGAYDTDKLKHASNCIENMKSIAEQAINKALK